MKERSLFGFDFLLLGSVLILIVIGILFIYSSGIDSEGRVVGFEVGIDQSDDVAALILAAGIELVEVRADLGGVARTVIGRKVAFIPPRDDK